MRFFLFNRTNIILLLLVLVHQIGDSQNFLCNSSWQICTAETVTYPGGQEFGTGETGPDYSCLYSQPNPGWFYMQIETVSSITLHIFNIDSEDVDFICWGPFSDPYGPCTAQLTMANEVDCSYSYTYDEYCYIPSTNMSIGDYYILLVTNYSEDPCTITIEKSAGTGETTCPELVINPTSNSPICEGDDIELYANIDGGTYFWLGPNDFTSTDQNPVIPYDEFLDQTGTYTLHVNTSDGSSLPTSTIVVISGEANADFTYTSACAGSPTSFTDQSSPQGSLNYEWDFGDGNTSTVQNPQNIYALAGTYIVVLTIDNGSCITSIQKNVVVTNNPTADFSYSFIDGTECVGSNIQFTNESNPGSNMTWEWDFGDGISANTMNPTHSFLSSGVFEITLTATNSNQCSDVFSQSIYINAAPSINFFSNQVCVGTETQFTNTTNAVEPYDLFYSFGDGTGESTASNPAYTYSSGGVYPATLQITDQNGCVNNITKDVLVNHLPIANFTNTTACLGDLTTFTNQSTCMSPPSTPIVSWFWDFGDGNTSNEQNPTHNYSSSGATNYDVILLVTTNKGCENEILQTVNLNVLPEADFTHNIACMGNPVEFQDLSICANPSTPVVEWLWNFGDGEISILQNPQHTYSLGGPSFLVSLTSTTSSGCEHTVEKLITLKLSPESEFSFTNACEGENINFYDESNSHPSFPIISWSWSFGDSETSSEQNPVHIFDANGPGIYEVSLATTNSNGCTNIITHQVSPFEAPNVEFEIDFPDGSNCSNSSVQFTDQSSIGAGYINSWYWDFGDGNYSLLPNPIHIYNSGWPTSFTVSLTTSSNLGCENSTSQNLTLNALPQAAFSFNSSCSSLEVEFFDESICINPDTPVVEWLWDFGDGNTSTEQNPLHVYAAGGPTSYSVTLSSTTTAGCENQITLTIDLFENPAADFEYTFSDGSSCIESIVEFDDASTTSEGEIVGWQWDFGDGNTSNQENPSHSYASSGTLIVSLTAENSNGCFDQNQLPITIHDFPVIDFSFNNVCAGSATQFNDTDYIIVDETEEWYYDFGDGSSSNQSNPAHIYQTSGDFVVTFTITDIYGCSSSTQKTVSVFELPIADFTNSTVCLYSPTQFTNQSSSSSGFDFYNWDFGDGATSSIQHPAHTFSVFGYHNVQLIVGSNNSCLDTIVQQVRVLEPPVANFLSSDSACMAGLVYFSDSSYSNESSIVSYLWNFPDGHISFDPNTYFVFLNTDIYYNISLLITDARGCKDTITETLFISPELSMNFNSDTVCFGQETELSAFIIEPITDSIIQYTWAFQDGSPQVTTTNSIIRHEFWEPGQFEVLLQAINSFGCESTIRRRIKVWENPIAEFSFHESSCNDSTLFFDESVAGDNNILSWTWNFGDGATQTINAPDTPDTYHTYAPFHAQYMSRLIVSDATSCLDSIDYTIAHFPCVMVNFYNDTNWICQNDVAVFIDSTVCDPDYTVNEKIWHFGDGHFTSVSPDVDTVIHQYSRFGDYEAMLLVNYQLDDVIVTDSIKKHVSILASPDVEFNTENICLGLGTPFQNTTHIDDDMLAWSYWNYGDGLDTVINYSSGGLEHNHIYEHDGTYTTTLIVKAFNNCVDSTSNELIVYPIPQIGFLADTTIHCKNARVYFTDTSHINSGIIANRLWAFGDGDFISTARDTVSHVFSSGTFTVSLQNTSDHFCQNNLTLNDYILINPIEKADFKIEPEKVSIEGLSNLNIINYVPTDSYLKWSLSDTILWENIYTPNIIDSIFDTGFYHLKLYTINEFGCIDSLTKSFEVTPVYNFYIPSAFSPNDNGINDSFGPVGKYFDMQSYEMRIYNRWGQVVFQTRDFFKHWDGRTVDGLRAPMGTYAYIIRLVDMDGNNKVIRGPVTLLL